MRNPPATAAKAGVAGSAGLWDTVCDLMMREQTDQTRLQTILAAGLRRKAGEMTA
jgi:hypothetical protein